jgi:hypothetical protein
MLEFLSSMSAIIFVDSAFGMLVYIFVMSNEHILVSLLTSMVFSSLISCVEFCMLYVYGRCRWLRRVLAKYFASSYAGAFFQLITGLMGMFPIKGILKTNKIVAFRRYKTQLWQI